MDGIVYISMQVAMVGLSESHFTGMSEEEAIFQMHASFTKDVTKSQSVK